MSHNTSDSAVGCTLQSICERLDSAYGLRVLSALRGESLLSFDGLVLRNTDAVSFAHDYFAKHFLSKWKGWKVKGVSPRDAALSTWLRTEAHNKQTNKRINNFVEGSGFPGTYLVTVISTAQALIKEVIGEFSILRVMNRCRWGPGATSDLPKGTRRDTKATTRGLSTTRLALPYMKALIESDPNWIEAITGFYPVGPVSLTKDFFMVTESSKWSTVPKTWETDRCIDMQPRANGYLQQGTGQFIRSRLRRVGIDLNSQEKNQDAAFRAVFEDLATVDLRNASDSLASGLVYLLFDWQWATWLEKLRTTFSDLPDGRRHKLEKFSAMGNAFTFELETLVFWALSKSVSINNGDPQSEVLVYGDDIVIASQHYDSLVYVLNFCGFQVNTEKSFCSGPFYESCGKHFFNSDEVTPIYQKETLDKPEELLRLHNRLVRWGQRIHGDPWYFDSELMILRELFADCFHEKIYRRFGLPRIPLTSVSDEGFLSDESELKADNNGGYYTVVFRRRKQRDRSKRNEAYYLATKLLYREFSNGHRKGYVEEDTGKGRYRLSRAYIYR